VAVKNPVEAKTKKKPLSRLEQLRLAKRGGN
jgi:hypothetical protein